MNKFWNVVGTVCGFYITVNIIFAILHEGGISTPFNFSNSIIITVCQVIFMVMIFLIAELAKYKED